MVPFVGDLQVKMTFIIGLVCVLGVALWGLAGCKRTPTPPPPPTDLYGYGKVVAENINKHCGKMGPGEVVTFTVKVESVRENELRIDSPITVNKGTLTIEVGKDAITWGPGADFEITKSGVTTRFHNREKPHIMFTFAGSEVIVYATSIERTSGVAIDYAKGEDQIVGPAGADSNFTFTVRTSADFEGKPLKFRMPAWN